MAISAGYHRASGPGLRWEEALSWCGVLMLGETVSPCGCPHLPAQRARQGGPRRLWVDMRGSGLGLPPSYLLLSAPTTCNNRQAHTGLPLTTPKSPCPCHPGLAQVPDPYTAWEDLLAGWPAQLPWARPQNPLLLSPTVQRQT